MIRTRRTALSVKLLARALLASVALATGAQLFVGGCDTDTPTTATPAPTPRGDWATLAATEQPEAAPAQPEAAPGQPGGAAGRSWEKSGVTVTIVADGWGPGTCHALADGRHCRTFQIENGSASSIYSRLAIFNGPEPGCAAYGPDGATNDPNMIDGPTSIEPGETATVSYCLTMNEKKCNRIQVDDSWGPFRLLVVGDVFDFARPCPRTVRITGTSSIFLPFELSKRSSILKSAPPVCNTYSRTSAYFRASAPGTMTALATLRPPAAFNVELKEAQVPLEPIGTFEPRETRAPEFPAGSTGTLSRKVDKGTHDIRVWVEGPCVEMSEHLWEIDVTCPGCALVR